MPYPLPTDHERRALFCWLKQASSVTAWRRLYSYHQTFVDAVQSVYEQEQNTPGMAMTIPTEYYASLLQNHDAFAAALERLLRSDRRCFAFLGARGHFSQGLLGVQWWREMYRGSFNGRNSFSPADSPRWHEIDEAMHACMSALTDIGVVLQTRHTDVPAPTYRIATYLSAPWSSLIKHWLKQTTLPRVPVARPEVLVPTGQIIPAYGIWEPIQMSSHGTIPLPPPTLVDGRNLDGCMNYLHGDFPAPTIAFPEDGQRREGRPTTWRLLWRDDRYADGAIPQEEQSYVFVQPVPGEVLFTYA